MSAINRIRKVIENRIVAWEGGEQKSCTARKISKHRYNVDVGMYTYGSCFLDSFNVGGKVVVGRYCSFGPNVRYFGANHPIQHASMSPYFYIKEWGFDVKDVPRESLKIGNDCWFGNNVTIVPSCTEIGNGAVIAAGAVVTGNVPDYAIVGGCQQKLYDTGLMRIQSICYKSPSGGNWSRQNSMSSMK